jgi:hypothetical protein
MCGVGETRVFVAERGSIDRERPTPGWDTDMTPTEVVPVLNGSITVRSDSDDGSPMWMDCRRPSVDTVALISARQRVESR